MVIVLSGDLFQTSITAARVTLRAFTRPTRLIRFRKPVTTAVQQNDAVPSNGHSLRGRAK
jgi:hypothetical protein